MTRTLSGALMAELIELQYQGGLQEPYYSDLYDLTDCEDYTY